MENNTIHQSSFHSIPEKDNTITYFILLWFFLMALSYKKKYTNNSTPINSHFTIHNNSKNKNKELTKIIGLDSVKDEIKYYMDFINNKNKYVKWNVTLPKGILLAGPPGTGKTLLVKTMANSLNIPIISASGSEFVELYIGLGASRIRELFKKAKTFEKCIIFIDEIDAIGKKRGLENNSERDNTLNQLLVEMDGFESNNNIIVFAATNLVRKLDTALTRSGRFDKKIYFDPPNFEERRKMFELYLTDIKVHSELSLDSLSERTAGLTGADIANACNQAKINAIQTNREISIIDELDMQEAIDEIMIGREKRERTMTENELERVAHHEAGHAFMGFILKECSQPIKVSIIPRGEAALGFSQAKSKDIKLYTKQMILSQISVLLGGRCAEKIIYNNISSGAYDDIEKISRLAYNYSVNWGMNNKIGPINPEIFEMFGENSINNMIFLESQQLVLDIEKQTIKILKSNKRYIKSIANLLLKNETISYKEIKHILPKRLENRVEIEFVK
jgi:ATP-dependent metalloprotease FtsH